MGIFDNGNKIYSPKYITAEITDEKDNIHFFPIKHTVDDYFIVEIDKQLYAFSTRGARILRYKHHLVKSFGVIQYDVSNYKSLNPATKELELVLKKNSLPKLNIRLFNILRMLGNREKNNFKPHDINLLIKEFETLEGDYPEKIAELRTYLKELDIDHITTPLRRITDFIHEDLIATNPNFLASVVPKLESVDNEHKKITNTEIKGTKNLMKYILIALVGIIIVAAVFIANDQGAFDGLFHLGDSLSGIGSSFQGLPSPTGGFTNPVKTDPYTDANIMAKYTPETLKAAINSGQIEYNKLSQKMKDAVDNVIVP